MTHSHGCDLFIIESVKDLIRYLRHEDDTRDIRQQLGAGQILQNDLLPIITQHTQDKPLFDACIRCLSALVFLIRYFLYKFYQIVAIPMTNYYNYQVM